MVERVFGFTLSLEPAPLSTREVALAAGPAAATLPLVLIVFPVVCMMVVVVVVGRGDRFDSLPPLSPPSRSPCEPHEPSI